MVALRPSRGSHRWTELLDKPTRQDGDVPTLNKASCWGHAPGKVGLMEEGMSKKDTGRLDWLEKNGGVSVGVIKGKWVYADNNTQEVLGAGDGSLREAIDFAMVAEALCKQSKK